MGNGKELLLITKYKNIESQFNNYRNLGLQKCIKQKFVAQLSKISAGIENSKGFSSAIKERKKLNKWRKDLNNLR